MREFCKSWQYFLTEKEMSLAPVFFISCHFRDDRKICQVPNWWTLPGTEHSSVPYSLTNSKYHSLSSTNYSVFFFFVYIQYFNGLASKEKEKERINIRHCFLCWSADVCVWH